MAIETTSTMSAAIRDYYELKFLQGLYPMLIWGDLADKVEADRGFGPTFQFRKYTPKRSSDTRADATNVSAALTEGTVPSEMPLAVESVNATALQYGNWVLISDWLKGNHISGVNTFVADGLKAIGKQAGEIVDNLIRDAAVSASGLNILYANGKTSATFDSSNDRLTMTDIRKAVRDLRGRFVPTFDNSNYVAVVSHFNTYDLQNEGGTGAWMDANKYTDIKDIRNGEIGKLFGVRFIESPIPATATDTNGTYSKVAVFGAETLKITHVAEVSQGDRVEMKHVNLYIKDPGSAGTADPINQRGSIGYKFNMAAKRVDDGRLSAIYSAQVS